ncbi:heterokaryon incompatibility protein [Fusarium tjaetaba]|uniref:Heterokaryon incompatibility protein n=1 Tax=Fusarium tjaetaba TaxID=1567544 RepID=A0A8H5QQV5_9HYPO|nr:heterokaryon incompatibility protein [Fusarium tjaetaba]KAF5619108.1 heterokaryon incompatibility protein [Fusarium tjaetaba]
MVAQIQPLRDMIYVPLPTGTNAIRLIKLKPRSCHRPAGISADLVVCELVSFSRGCCPPYTAVSYAWGKSTTSSQLAIGDQIYEVSCTVEQVLRQLVVEDADRFVWVDQICINQQDNAEKSDQVQQMKSIYTEAYLVIAWLGPAADDSDMLLKHIERMGEAIWADDHSSVLAAHSNKEGLQAISRAFRSLCQREYWKRLWIIQEFAVGSSLRIACGDVMVWDWNLEALLAYMNQLLEGHFSRSPDRSSDPLGDSLPRAYLTSATSFMEGVVTRRCRYWARQDGDISSDALFYVLVTTLVLERDYNQPQATNPLDRVFSILHLAHDADEFVNIIDYSRSCEEIYREIALVILKQGHIDLLAYCQFPKLSPDMPTWTPDWRTQIRSPCTGPPWSHSFCASAGMASQQCVTSLDEHSIQLKGAIVGAIEQCGSVWNPDWTGSLDVSQTIAYLQEIQSFCTRSRQLTPDEAERAAAHVAIAAAYDKTEVQKEFHNCIQAWRELMDYLKLSTSPTSDSVMEPQIDGHLAKELTADHSWDSWQSSHWYTTRLRFLHSRVPILLESGHVGLASSNTKKGDQICVFVGGKVPYIIRPVEKVLGEFQLVGEVYIYGMMSGEPVNESTIINSIVLR